MSVIGPMPTDDDDPEKIGEGSHMWNAKSNHEQVMENAAIKGLLLLEDILEMLKTINFNMRGRGFKP